MFIFLIILSWICIYGMKISPVKQFNQNYISRDNTTAVKGIFVFLVFMSHFIQYYEMSTVFDNPYKFVRVFLGQLVVVMFLFYSGYGIYESVKRKGTDYIKSFPTNRVLKTLLHLDLAVMLFFILNLITGKPMTVEKVLWSLIGWKNIGNSNWFMFTILVLYLVIYLAFMIFKKHKVFALVFTTVLTFGYIAIMRHGFELAAYWYNTSLCLPLGLWYSFFKEKIEKIVMKNNITWFITTALCAAVFLFCHLHKREFGIYLLWTLSFTLLVVFVTMKVELGNKALYWLGNHVFSVYILQRLPMSVFDSIEAISSNRYLFFILSFVVTVIISEIFDRATGALDKVLFKKRIKK